MQKSSSEKLYSSCFERGYFAAAAADFRSTRKLAFAGITMALSVSLQLFYIPLAPGLRIQITFLVSALSGAILGPWLSLVRGAASDVIGFFVANTGGGAFFFGYTLSAALGAMIYSLFFYRKRITYKRIFFSKLIINLFCNAALGSLWNSILYGSRSYGAYFALAFTKNILLLPLEVVVICLIFNLMLPTLSKLGMVRREQCGEIKVSYARLGIEVAVAAVLAILLWVFYADIYAFVKSLL